MYCDEKKFIKIYLKIFKLIEHKFTVEIYKRYIIYTYVMYTRFQNIKAIIRLRSCYKATMKIKCIETRNANFCKLIFIN